MAKRNAYEQGKKAEKPQNEKRPYRKKKKRTGGENWSDQIPKHTRRWWEEFCRFPCKP